MKCFGCNIGGVYRRPDQRIAEALLQLEPVTFRYKEELDPEKVPQFGLIAKQVEKVNPDLVARDEDGKITTVRYDAVNAMLLNEFLKEHRTVEELKAAGAKQSAIAQAQEGTIAQLKKQVAELAAGLQKVNEQVALQKPVPQIVANQH